MLVMSMTTLNMVAIRVGLIKKYVENTTNFYEKLETQEMSDVVKCFPYFLFFPWNLTSPKEFDPPIN